MKVGVADVGGFVGRRVAERLAVRGHELVLVDPVAHPTHPTLPWDYASSEGLSALSACDAVLHLAAASGIVTSATDPASVRRANLSGLCRLAEAFQEARILLLFASSFSVMGNPRDHPIAESQPNAPMNECARQKVAGEMIVRSLGRSRWVLQMSNIYVSFSIEGRSYYASTVLALLVDRTRAGRLRSHAPGTQARDCLHIVDTSRIWVVAVEYCRSPSAEGSEFYSANGEVWTVRTLAHEVRNMLRVRIPEEVGANSREESLPPDIPIDTRSTRGRVRVIPEHDVLGTFHSELLDPTSV